MMGTATPMKTSKKSQRRSRFSNLSKNSATLLPSSETQVPTLDPEDDSDCHRGGAERRADDDARLGRAVRGLHDPLGEPPQCLARARCGGLKRGERSRQELEQGNATRHDEDAGGEEDGGLGVPGAERAEGGRGHEEREEREDGGLERQEEMIRDPLE